MPLIKDIKAVFIGGPGATKEYFFEKDYLRNEVKAKVKDLLDIGYTDETGLREIVEKASETMKEMRIAKEKDLMNRFMMEIRKPDGGLGVYGETAIKNALEQKSLDLLIISEDLNKVHYRYRCPQCGNTRELMTKPDGNVICDKCSTPMVLEEEEDLVEVFYRLADASGAKVEIISGNSDEGKLLQKAFGGMAGILRYVPKAANPPQQ